MVTMPRMRSCNRAVCSSSTSCRMAWITPWRSRSCMQIPRKVSHIFQLCLLRLHASVMHVRASRRLPSDECEAARFAHASLCSSSTPTHRENVNTESSKRCKRNSATPFVNQMSACNGLMSSASLKHSTAFGRSPLPKWWRPRERCARAKRRFDSSQAASKCAGSFMMSPRQHHKRGLAWAASCSRIISSASTFRSAIMRHSTASGHIRRRLNCSWAVLTMPMRIIRVPISRCRWKCAG
mmetsp:Transcript_16200/g.48123  ORF Transcript_16200/g.48123 Transcript_16200/m.48123 type:complete len:239 (-) Transcript_16200:739-1455(-)